MIDPKHFDLPWTAEWSETLDSTSLEAVRRAGSGEEGPVWIATKEQTAGRGRLGRKWVSEPGNLYTTALLPVSGFSADDSCTPLAIGLAVRDLVVEVTQGRLIPGLKWPNDVRLDGAKLSGILLETGRRQDASSDWLCIGIGINLAQAPEIPDYATASLKSLLPDFIPDPESALMHLDISVRKRLKQLGHAGRESIISDWMLATDQKDSMCRVTFGDTTIEGKFAGLDGFGQLRLTKTDGTTQTITAGDVELIKERTTNAAGD